MVVPAEAAAFSNPADASSQFLATIGRNQPRETAYVTTVRAWQRVVRAGLSVRQLPASLQPLSPHLSKAFTPPCIHGLPGTVSDECVVGNPSAGQVAVLNGDSHAEMLRYSFWRAFDPKTWSIHVFARDACGWAGGPGSEALSATDCARRQAQALRRIRALHPDVLLLSEHRVVLRSARVPTSHQVSQRSRTPPRGRSS